MMSVKFLKFLNKGQGVMGRSLEPVFVLGFWVIPVELQFSIDPATYDQHRNLRPVNWSGTDAIWFKSGNPLSSLWQLHSNSKGIGPDGPDAGNTLIGRDVIAYYDNPGLPLQKIREIRPNASWVWLVQNFTGWIEGEPIQNGPAERLCDVAAWWSIVSVTNFSWQDPKLPGDWQLTSGTGSGTGWADTLKAGPI
jgi:hypothetical protein